MDAQRKESILVSLRKELGLTQKTMADELGVSEQTVRNWEQGKAIPKLTIPQMKVLCQLLKRPIEQVPDYFGYIQEETLEKQSAEDASNIPGARPPKKEVIDKLNSQ